MVVSLSGKLTHLAHSLRHGSHSLRNAFPTTANPGFDFTSNVFGTVSNAATNSGGAGAASAIAAGALGAGAGAAASAGSGGATGGSGGASSKAGSWGTNWGFQVRAMSFEESGLDGRRLTRDPLPPPQTGKSVTQGQAAQTDSQLQDEADDLRTLAASTKGGRSTILRPVATRVTSTSASSSGLIFRSRKGSVSSNSGSLDGTELLRAEEAGLSHVRLSSVEMQRRYHSAFAQGLLPTREELEADEMDAMMLADADSVSEADRVSGPADVLRSGRRASISNRPTMTLASPFVITTPPAVTPARASTNSSSSIRQVHTSTPPEQPSASDHIISSSGADLVASTSSSAAPTFSSPRPPSPTFPRHRRNSTSAVPSPSSVASGSGSAIDLPPRSSTRPVQKNRRLKIRRDKGSKVGAEASRAKAELGSFGWEKSTRVQEGLDNPEASVSLAPLDMDRNSRLSICSSQDRLNAILAAEKTGKINLVERAVQQYLAHREIWNTATHNAAIAAIYRTRKPNDPLDRIVLLYNQLFDHGALHPNRASYEHVITAFCTRDKEVRESISYLERRIAKRELVNRARGPWHVGFDAAQEDRSGEADERLLNERERERLAQLCGPQSDYFTPAHEIFQALGKLGDRLHPHVVQSLLVAAAERGQVDTALALFERLEKSAFQKAGYMGYEALVRMYGSVEKDAGLVREVFEAYLAARAKGDIVLPRTGDRFAPTTGYRTRTIKHGYDVEPEFVETRVQSINADERIWQAAILALFEAGDASGAVALVEKLLVALNSGDALPNGYPARLSQRIVQSVVRGFLAQGDEASARTWFDRIATAPGSKEVVSPAFCGMTLSRAVEADMTDFSNHVYRVMLGRTGRDLSLRVADFALVVDQNLASAWAAKSAAEREKALDAIVEFRSGFEAATKAGRLEEGHGIDYAASTGLLSRICTGMGGFGRFDQATATFAELANLVRTVMRRTPDDEELARQQTKRTRRDWVTRITDVATGTLGYRRAASFTGPAQLERQTQERPSLHEAIKVVGWTNKLRHVVRWAPRMDHCIAVTEAYILTRQEQDVAPQLTGDEWYVAVEAFAHVSALVRRGTKLDFAFPGFDLVFDDFCASGVEIPVGFDTYDYSALEQALHAGGLHPARVRDIVAVLNHQSSVDTPEHQGLAASLTGKEGFQPEVTTPADEVASLASESVGAATSATPHTPASEPARLPTPPPSPPSYLPAAATAPPPSTIDVFDRVLSKHLEDLAYNGKSMQAFALAQQAAIKGSFAHPDSYGRVIEALGRQHRVDEVRKVYLIAYQALTAMSHKPDEQSVAWVMLEDRMIVALGQAGALVDVGHHRDRLLQAGCAPSADAYAAMILNMRDTTDDAAVALTLFEESQRLNVRPNVYLFNTLISKLSRARRAKEALEYFELMKQFGLRPSSITYGAIINACCKTGDDVSADYLFKEMVSHPEFKPRVPPYNTMIQFYTSVKPSRERALFYYDQLLRAKVPPTAHTYKLLLDAYGGIGEPDLDSMQRIFTRLVNDKHVSVSGAHWAAMINAYGTVAKKLDRTLAIFDSIRDHPTSRGNPNGPQPDAVVYEALFSALIVNGRPDLCDRYLDEMRARNVRMTAYVANNLIKVRPLSLFRVTRKAPPTDSYYSPMRDRPTRRWASSTALAPSSLRSRTLLRASPRPVTTPSTVTQSTTTKGQEPTPRRRRRRRRASTCRRTANRRRTKR
jgi:pentatricopeptide repeat protein